MLNATTETEHAATVGTDAMTENRLVEAGKLLIGMPCTISIGSDHYAAEVVKVTRCTITARYTDEVRSHRDAMTFRFTGNYWTYRGHWHLTLGRAETRIDLDR